MLILPSRNLVLKELSLLLAQATLLFSSFPLPPSLHLATYTNLGLALLKSLPGPPLA